MKLIKSQFSKIKCSSSFLLPFVLMVWTCLFVVSLCRPTLKSSPDYKIFTNFGNGTAIKISSDEKYIMIGYDNGSAKIYDIIELNYYTCYGHNSRIIDMSTYKDMGG